MFALEVQDHIMIGHSLPAEVFGPAQGMHGATFTVHAAFYAQELDEHSLVVDIGLATKVLGEVLSVLNYQNLDQIPKFQGKFTTTEFLCRYIFDEVVIRLRSGELGDHGRVKRLRIKLEESYAARAWFEGEI